jgi:hypothetical protein
MTVKTVTKQEFGSLVDKILGELSYSKAENISGISGEYLRKMRMGRVPSEDVIARFADAFKERGADLTALRIAAGYEQPSDVVERVAMALRCDKILTDKGKQQVLDLVKELRDKYGEPGGDAKKD